MIYIYWVFFVIAQWTLPNIILIRDIDMFSTYVPSCGTVALYGPFYLFYFFCGPKKQNK
jgi:hypothetical protein